MKTKLKGRAFTVTLPLGIADRIAKESKAQHLAQSAYIRHLLLNDFGVKQQ